MWGGLRPITSRLFLDALALTLQVYCLSLAPSNATGNGALPLSVGTLVLTVYTAGSFTNRWTLAFPMVPFVLMQWLRTLTSVQEGYWANLSIVLFSVVLIVSGAVLSVLFGAVELPPVKGRGSDSDSDSDSESKLYNVGVVDLHLPVFLQRNETDKDDNEQHVTARILYPTSDPNSTIPYLDPKTANDFCVQSMKIGPPPLRKLGWILHTWKLIRLRAKRNATPLDNKRFPLVVYSHGLGGTSEIYSYQTLQLAANGFIVLSLDHTDGSAAVVERKDGSISMRDLEIDKLFDVEHVRARRAFTDHRVDEFVGATKAMLSLTQVNIPELQHVGVSFVDKIDTSGTNKAVFMGHSFGAATALAAALREPTLPSCIVAHEPMVDWLPDDTRRSLFPVERLKDSKHSYSGGTGGFEPEKGNGRGDKDINSEALSHQSASVHDLDMLFLFSDEWFQQNWGCSHILKCMLQRGELGRKGGVSDFGVIRNANHSEFSDISMLIPLWLGRSSGMTGKRDPIDSSREIGERTLDFLRSV